MANVHFISHESMVGHDPGPGHPERPHRLRALIDHFRPAAAASGAWMEAHPAARSNVLLAHSRTYADSIYRLRGQNKRLDIDTVVSPDSVDAAYLAAGAAGASVDMTLENRDTVPFALVRPPGHHAEAGMARGFCLFNSIAIAAKHAIVNRGLERVLIVDWDVHHGNGTQHIVETDPRVLYFSVHQEPFYPGTGALDENGIGDGEGFTVNAPLPAGAGDSLYVALFHEVLVPIAMAFRPQLVLVSAGFDAHRNDPLAMMNVSESGFSAMMRLVCQIADRACGGRLALVLEGGYDIRGLVDSAQACVDVLKGEQVPAEVREETLSRNDRRVLDTIRRFHARRWTL